MSRRVGEYEKMEKQLKKALQEAKKGELTVLEQEKELTRMRDDLQKEKDRIRQDVKTTIEQQKRELNGILKVSHVSIFSLFECALLVIIKSLKNWTPPYNISYFSLTFFRSNVQKRLLPRSVRACIVPNLTNQKININFC